VAEPLALDDFRCGLGISFSSFIRLMVNPRIVVVERSWRTTCAALRPFFSTSVL
jgi:hypothetical protein